MGGGTDSPSPPSFPALSFSLLLSLGLRHKKASAARERVFRTTRFLLISFELKINEKLQRENVTAIRAYYKKKNTL